MDFLCQFESLNTLSFDITLDDLYHGIQGRVKDLDHLVTEFELFQVSTFPKLANLVIDIKRNGVQLTPEIVSLLIELEDWFTEGVMGKVVFVSSE